LISGTSPCCNLALSKLNFDRLLQVGGQLSTGSAPCPLLSSLLHFHHPSLIRSLALTLCAGAASIDVVRKHVDLTLWDAVGHYYGAYDHFGHLGHLDASVILMFSPSITQMRWGNGACGCFRCFLHPAISSLCALAVDPGSETLYPQRTIHPRRMQEGSQT
jgi:hypothetical protein